MSEIEELTAALERMAPGPERDEACGDLCRAYLERADQDDSPADLDLAIEAAERADDPEDTYVRYALAWAYGCRWDCGEDPADRDRAIDHWHAVLAVVEDLAGLAECARLLGERAEAEEDVADVSASIELFERAAAAGERPWWLLGMVYRMRWHLGDDLADLRRVAQNFDAGLAEPSSPEWLVAAYLDRLEVARALVRAESAVDSHGIPAGVSDLRRVIGEARRVFESGAGEHDDRARLAVGMAVATSLTGAGQHPEAVDVAWLREMTAVGRTLTDPPPGWELQLNTLDAMVAFTERARSGGGLPDEALETLVAPLRDGDVDPGVGKELQKVATMFMAARAIQSGDRRSLRAAIDRFHASEDPEERLFGDAYELADRAQFGDPSVRADLQVLLARVRTEPLSFETRQGLVPLLTMIESGLSGGDGAYRPVDRTPIPAGDIPAADAALQALIGPMQAARTRHDVVALRECAERFDELLAVLPPGHLLRLVALGLAVAAAESLLVDEPGDPEAAHRLLRWTEDGLGMAAGPHHPRWTAFALSRGEALRQLGEGDRAESRRWGLDGLRGLAWRVLLQSGTDDAVTVAAEAGAVARRVAGWCQADGALDDMVAALDAGRGLVLYAATASRTIAERLSEAGHPDLADEWRASAGYGRDAITGDPLGAGRGLEVPDDLRARVLRALDLSTPVPASTADIRDGLAAAGADALVYLVPSSWEQPGAAVIVPVGGEPSLLVLPGLIIGPGSRLATTGGRLRDAGPAEEPGGQAGAGPDELCGWAWSAAMEPVLRRSGLRRSDGPLRLVLVPTGPLSSVPWHAAFRTEGDRRRYAVEEAVISYAVSGRAFVESAREPARTVKSVLIVGDPTGDLPFAGLEARAIGAAFYPEAAFARAPREVLDWVVAAAPGPSLLHLACHGRADPAHPAEACLRLAGGELTARRLLDASRTASLEIEQVFLAACTTGLTGIDHDEAFSLTTAFLAAGARTAFGSLWPVPDEETSVLMYLVHHHLAEGCTPVDALHRAQLWMLDPERKPPAGMPAELVRHCDGPRPAEPRCWAAFTHQGR
ncbi:CHAT domain-containing protein [Paractinoplanes globisporus]|uniref:CHAT domain-containing protein n=1 Tax=Paractinoplanes globisporus TaxID=113565 RepID=A0ABW6W9D6_9ACTN|nr:CHAT domain-containing protein [Actinoplanes globisporus]